MTTIGDAWELRKSAPPPQPHQPVPANMFIEPPPPRVITPPPVTVAPAEHSDNMQQIQQLMQTFLEIGDQRRDQRDNRLFFAMENMLNSQHAPSDNLVRRSDLYTPAILLGILTITIIGLLIYAACRCNTIHQCIKSLGMERLQVEDLIDLAVI